MQLNHITFACFSFGYSPAITAQSNNSTSIEVSSYAWPDYILCSPAWELISFVCFFSLLWTHDSLKRIFSHREMDTENIWDLMQAIVSLVFYEKTFAPDFRCHQLCDVVRRVSIEFNTFWFSLTNSLVFLKLLATYRFTCTVTTPVTSL